ncbi:MAG TPA: glycosyl hydrolase [Abditibacteriaceae bacterium]
MTDWPKIEQEHRPWTRWWWPGSAVTSEEITRHLQAFHKAGIGGVEISPIYAVPGQETRSVPYLSECWMQMLKHTLSEARRFYMGVDIITGTGWPLGGSWVPTADGPLKLYLQNFKMGEAIRSKEKPEAELTALVGFFNDQILNLTDKVNADGQLKWEAPPGNWSLIGAFVLNTGQQVKRAGPGGEGNVLDHLSAPAVQRYLEHFDEPLKQLNGEMPRCFFNDSYEVFGANWTTDLWRQFEQRRGYDLRHHLISLNGEGDKETVSRVRSDYRQTVHELLLEEFTGQWTKWAHEKGAQTRNQAHGSPGNLLDLYAAADVPETEVFRTAFIEIAGLKPLPGTPLQGELKEEIFVCKMASSAAHVAGKKLCSSESFTWLGEHGKVPLEHAKTEVDLLFTTGINHIFFHGTPFSPSDAPWPGWMFYATTHMAPSNPFWRDISALNAYIARCQSFLQSGTPDNDILLYLPIYDLWAQDKGSRDNLQFMTVHNAPDWLGAMSGYKQACERMWDRGYAFDSISDAQIQSVQFTNGALQAPGASYRVLVVPNSHFMPLGTLEKLVQLAHSGATILCVGDLPQDVPGLVDLTARRAKFQNVIRKIKSGLRVVRNTENFLSYGVGKGAISVSKDLEELFAAAKIPRESLTDDNLEFVRRRDGDGWIYFVVNLGKTRVDKWLDFAAPQKALSAIGFDAMTGITGKLPVRNRNGKTQIYLQLEVGGSLLIRALPQKVETPVLGVYETSPTHLPLNGPWHIEFVEGGPQLPSARKIKELSDWTTWTQDDEQLRAFSGTARYSVHFARPAITADGWELYLGEVCHSAHVRLNNHDLGKVIARPWRVRFEPSLLQDENLLEIEVTNLMANRLADLDRRKIDWHPFNFVDINYEPFDASNWEPVPSGLIGPVRLMPLQKKDVKE